MNTNNPSLLETVRESFGRVVYSHKTHEKMAEILEAKRACATVVEVLSLALSASGILSLQYHDENLVKAASAGLAFISLGFALYRAFANLDHRISENKRAACALWILREHYINLISDFSEGRLTEKAAQDERNRLQDVAHKIYETAPQTTSCAYKKAQKALKENEDFTFTPEEIDKFLPASLKLKR